jgi:hypothetical protein
MFSPGLKLKRLNKNMEPLTQILENAQLSFKILNIKEEKSHIYHIYKLILILFKTKKERERIFTKERFPKE